MSGDPTCSRRRVRRGLIVAMLSVIAACGGGDGGDAASTTTPPPSSRTGASGPAGTGGASGLAEVTGPFAPGRTQLPGFGEVEVRIVDGPNGEPIILCVLLAETGPQRQRGLMQVADEDLGGYDGMLFTYESDVEGGFWMKDTLLPLSIAYLEADGTPIHTTDMEPCPPETERCPSYPPPAPYRMALEVTQGGLDDLGLVEGAGGRLEVGGACAPGPGADS